MKTLVARRGIVAFFDEGNCSVYMSPRALDLKAEVCDGGWHVIQVAYPECEIKVDEECGLVV